jgi:Glyoxalase-like domain
VLECLDHIIWACEDLERGRRRFEALTGISPRFGGVHASGVTHNALVGLGGPRYLEIVAPVKGPRPDDDDWTRLARASTEPRVLTYCLRSPVPLEKLARTCVALGWRNTSIASSGRTRPDGLRLRWRVLRPEAEPYGLAFPFFIDWLNSPHPSESTPSPEPDAAARLTSFGVGHPKAAGLAHALAGFGCQVTTYEAPATCFRVMLDTSRGPISL